MFNFDALTQPHVLIALATSIAVFATLMSLIMPMFRQDKIGARMKSVALERDKMRSEARARYTSEKSTVRGNAKNKEPGAVVRAIVEKLSLKTLLADEQTEALLIQAGYRGQAPLFVFLSLRLGLPLLFALLSTLYFIVLSPSPERGSFTTLLYVLGFAFFGFYLPLLLAKNNRSKRQLSITRAWPDALDLCLICVESGMTIEAAFKKVASEIKEQSMELSEELMLTTAELSFLQERRDAYQNLTQRTGLDSVKNVVLSLVQAEKYGTPLGSALRVLSQENRDIRMAMAEKKAAGLPPKLTVPMMVCFLPVLFCVILGPVAIIASQ